MKEFDFMFIQFGRWYCGGSSSLMTYKLKKQNVKNVFLIIFFKNERADMKHVKKLKSIGKIKTKRTFSYMYYKKEKIRDGGNQNYKIKGER